MCCSWGMTMKCRVGGFGAFACVGFCLVAKNVSVQPMSQRGIAMGITMSAAILFRRGID